jgi:TonB-dependent receptor
MMKKKLLTVALALFSFFTLISAQDKGIISGKIIDKSNGESLPGAAIRLDGTTIGTVSDIEGNFQLSAPVGSQVIEISFISYTTGKLTVEVKKNETTNVSYVMEEAKSLELDVVVVTATVEKSTTTAMMIERKKAAQVSDGVSADLIRRTPDRTTSDVLKRVTGASIQEGKFAIIRGMNDRYNAGYLDGALLPSTESDRKAFAFDAIPANLIDNIVILKAGTPDLIGDFGGGVIKINTKSVPEKFMQSLNVGIQTNSLTTFKDFKEFKRYGGEAFNIFGSERDLPSITEGGLKTATSFPTKTERTRLATNSQPFNHDWSNTVASAVPNSRLAYSLGFPIRLSDDKKMGVLMALTYANTRRFSEGEVNTFNESGQTSAFKDNVYFQNISSGGILNVNYVASKTQISLRNLLNMNQDNNTYSRDGVGNISDGLNVRNSANLINYNRLYNGILSLKQIIGNNDWTIHAAINYSDVVRNIPDYRIANYFNTPDFSGYRLSVGDFFRTSTGRFTSKLNESILGGSFDIDKQLMLGKIKTDIRLGYNYQKRDRTFFGRSFVYNGVTAGDNTGNPENDLGSKNIGETKLVLIEKTNDGTDYYGGKSDLSGYFLSIDQTYTDKFRAVYGVRYEDFNLNIINQKFNASVSSIKEGVWLPSANLTYSLSEKTNLRMAYYASVNRPEFRELAPFVLYNFDKNIELQGYSDLKVAKLNNFDVRFELFPTGGQLISVGGFYKTIDKPIELSIDIAQPFTTFTYGNQKAAKIYGLEFEVKKNLDFIGSAKIWHNLSIYSNLSLIQSALTFDPGSSAKQDRPLQGQSPYIINGGLQYDNSDNGWFGSLVFNRIGRRIGFVGVDKKFGETRQDIYEAPRNVLDFQIGKNFKNLNIKLTMGDILSNDLVFYQDNNQDGTYNVGAQSGDLLMFKYTNGFTAALSVGYTF